MKTYYKYSILVLGIIVVGSEVMFKCLKQVRRLLHSKGSDSMKNPKKSCDAKRQRTVNKVIFFPDQGILSRLPATNTRCGRQDSALRETRRDNIREDSYEKPHLSRPHSYNENGELYSSYLKRSTSLIHLVEALECARRSLKVCVYVITLPDCVVALVRAKNRGVHVRVMVEGQMPNDAALAKLRKNNIAVRVSHTSQLLHHKFALRDVPDQEASVPGNASATGRCGERWFSRFRVYLSGKAIPSQHVLAAQSAEPLLMTGSFNWTWSAVVNNFENVIISSDCDLIRHYSEEFERLWKNLEAS
ncbi:Mitochondrial cardiolipin hydrolase [Chionoecetes opilio]|uniref:Mitochondrial cardiolipin hydrolase n=1 Tax=Chionoecetes opilio TaxID=41210 RepID=A0A8J4YM55_CHIOP|nr:Mitochondrial cardiolipin hydrolase [Chionoecetes opilio]